MVDPLLYFAAGTLLFFFWAYGIVSFVLDLKNKLLPAARQYVRGRREQQAAEAEREGRERLEEQLY